MLSKTEIMLIDLLTGKHTKMIQELIEDHDSQKDMFLRDVYHSINDEFPELELGNIEMSQEDIGRAMVKIADNHVITDKICEEDTTAQQKEERMR